VPSTPGPVAPGALVSLAEIRDAAARLGGVALRTPLLPFGPPLDGDPQGRPRAWLKAESLQPIGAFKIRGAYNAMAQLSADELQRGVVAHSSGNHAQGVARAARLLGARAVLVMPRDAARVKVAAVRADGARIEFVGPAGEERIARADELVAAEGLTLIPAYDDARVVAGQGTVGLEVVEQLDELDLAVAPTVLVPVGGGGLASGVAAAVKALRPDARVLGVEPELAADARDSLAEGRIVRWAPELTTRTLADGMRASAIGRIPFAHMSVLLDGVITVSEDEIARATLRAARAARLIVEPSGATSVAAWLFHAAELPASGPVVAVVSGGNVDPATHARLLDTAEAAGG
jgi:threo-3-hydroxy-L-aspartate ammonia-lyase